MTVPVWTPGTLYLPGSLVRPASGGPVVPATITNPGFESGDSGWTKETGWTITNTGEEFAGSWSATFDHTSTTNRILSTAVATVPGRSITAACYLSDKGGAGGSNAAGGAIILRWLDGASAEIEVDEGNSITDSANGWMKSTVTAVAPDNAAFVQVGVRGFRTSGTDKIYADNFTWNAVTQQSLDGLIYEATQTDPGTSANTEPTWPTVLGNTVVDGSVTWEAVSSTRVTWRASHLMVTSNSTEPTWPTTPGLFVADGSVSWECVGRHIQDVNCPHSRVVAIAAGKVFAADGDIVRFCATANPLDWSTAEDAGYLPTGLQQANSNDAAVLNLYRGNLVVFNASTFQMWQIDPDPKAMALLDQMEGIGSEQPRAAHAVGNELFFLSQLGVRSVGISAGSHLSSGDVGAGVDSLVQIAQLVTEAAGQQPVATYYPSAGQYWLAFPGEPEA